MFTKSSLIRVVSLSILILSMTAFALADTIRLKDGSIIKGKIVSFTNGQFVILVGDGARQRKLNFFADEIDSIIFDSRNKPAEVVKTSATKQPTPVKTAPTKPTYSKTTNGDDTIITVGSAPPSAKTDTSTKSSRNSSNSSKLKPIRINTKVLADNTANGWTNSGWVVRKGQRITIRGNGRISLGNGRYSSASGISTLPDKQKLIKDKPTGGLIAVIGDDNNDFIFIGSKREFVAKRDGALFLGVNEGVLTDNTGAFDVVIEIDSRIVK